jgi:hypothetical protein
MKAQQDPIRDIAEMRSMMERSTKFLSLSGLAGVMVGIYGLVAAYIAYRVFQFNPDTILYPDGSEEIQAQIMTRVIYLGMGSLILGLVTVILLSIRKAGRREEKFWTSTSRRLSTHMAVPFLTGALFILILIDKGLIGLVAPASLVFYGLALYNAGKFTYDEVKTLGLIEIALGLFSLFYIHYGVVCWALGFGMAHILYGLYMYYRYDR